MNCGLSRGGGGTLIQDRAARTGVFWGEALEGDRAAWLAADCTETALCKSRFHQALVFQATTKLSFFSGFSYLFVWDLLFSWVWGVFFSGSKAAFEIARSWSKLKVNWKLRQHLSLGHLWFPWIEKVMILVGIFQESLIRTWIWGGNTCDFCIAPWNSDEGHHC